MKEEEYKVANFATLLSKTLIFSLPKMDEFNFSRFLKDENEILQAKDQHSRDFPTFRVHFGEFFLTIFFLLKLKTRAIPRQPRPPSQQETKKIKSYNKSWMFQDFLSFQVMKYMSCAKWRWGKLGADSSD